MQDLHIEEQWQVMASPFLIFEKGVERGQRPASRSTAKDSDWRRKIDLVRRGPGPDGRDTNSKVLCDLLDGEVTLLRRKGLLCGERLCVESDG